VSSTEIETPRGPAGIRITEPAGPAVSLLVLGHGAGGDVNAPDLTAVHDAAVAAGVRVALVTQPYRMAGRRAPAPANHLDEAWTAVLTQLMQAQLLQAQLMRAQIAVPGQIVVPGQIAVPELPLIVGGRSSGARVACRTAATLGAAGVLALAFPLHPPGKPDRSRADELPTTIPTLVLNGDRDPFGVPTPTRTVRVEIRPGATHDLRKGVHETAALAVTWLINNSWARSPR
jgi:predicted alpha/beta-hydrolase family hydrolase